MPVQFQQIILFCADVGKLVAFYQENFGFTLAEAQTANWAVLNTGAITIAFHKTGDAYLKTADENFSVQNNIKLVFETGTDLVPFRQQLLDKKVTIGEIKQFPGANYLVCDGHDPEGNVFQLKQVLR